MKKVKKKNENVEVNNKNKGVIITLIIGIIISLILGIVFYKYNPIKVKINENGINYLTNYTYNFFTFNKKNLSAFNSIFPIALFIGVYYIFKDETKHSAFMIPTILVSIIELFFLVSKANLSFIPNCIFSLGFDLLQIFMVVYIFSRIEEKYFGLVKSSYISLIGLVFLLFMPVAKGINNAGIEVSYIIFVLESYLLLNYQDIRFKKLASFVFTLICLGEFIGYSIVNFL